MKSIHALKIIIIVTHPTREFLEGGQYLGLLRRVKADLHGTTLLYAYDKPRTQVVLCKSNRQLDCDRHV